MKPGLRWARTFGIVARASGRGPDLSCVLRCYRSEKHRNSKFINNLSVAFLKVNSNWTGFMSRARRRVAFHSLIWIIVGLIALAVLAVSVTAWSLRSDQAAAGVRET